MIKGDADHSDFVIADRADRHVQASIRHRRGRGVDPASAIRPEDNQVVHGLLRQRRVCAGDFTEYDFTGAGRIPVTATVRVKIAVNGIVRDVIAGIESADRDAREQGSEVHGAAVRAAARVVDLGRCREREKGKHEDGQRGDLFLTACFKKSSKHSGSPK